MGSISAPQAYGIEEFTTLDIKGPAYSSSFLNSIIIPRPIAFITSMGPSGIVNAAPFSYFNIVCTNPPIVSIAIERRNGQRKDTSENIRFKKEFVVNICSIELAKAISIAGGDFPPDISEVELARLSLIASDEISVPRIANTLIQMECVLNQMIEVGKDPTDLTLGQILKVHLHKNIINEKGQVDIEKLNPIARLAGSTFAKVNNYFDIARGL